MAFLGIRHIDQAEGGLDRWSFAHAQHHLDLITKLGQAVSFTGNTVNNSKLITNLSTTTGLLVNMGLTGAGIPLNSTITAIDTINLNLTISNFATATSAGVVLSAGFAPFTSYILDPISTDGRGQFLIDHQNAHNAINSALGQSGSDLQDLDFDNRDQVTAWLDLNFDEHQAWMLSTGIT